MAKGLQGLIGAIAPIIILVVVAFIVVKFQTDIGNFIGKLTQSETEKAEEKRVDENGVFDNLVEFFFGKPTEDKPATDDGVSKNDFDQNSATQQQRASKAQSFSDEQLIADIANQNSQTNTVGGTGLFDSGTRRGRDSGGGFQGSSVGVSDTITATVIRGSNSVSPTKTKGRKITVNLGSGSGSRITATPQGLVTTRSGGGQSSSRASRGGSSGSSVGVSDRITATIVRGSSSSSSARPKGNLSTQSQKLNTKTRGSSRFNR